MTDDMLTALADATSSPQESLVLSLAHRLGWEVCVDAKAHGLKTTLDMITAADRAGVEILDQQHSYQNKAEEAMSDVAGTLGRMFTKPELVALGRLRGHTVMLLPDLAPRATATTVLVMFPHPLSLKLNIHRESWADKAAKMFLRMQDVQTGHHELDKLVMIKTDDDHAARCLLATQEARDALLRLYGSPGSFRRLPVVNDVAARAGLFESYSEQDLMDTVNALIDVSVALGTDYSS